MTIQTETKLRDFDFWSGGAVNARKLSPEELDTLESYLDPTGEEVMTATEINDFLWFDEETYLPLLGITQDEWDER